MGLVEIFTLYYDTYLHHKLRVTFTTETQYIYIKSFNLKVPQIFRKILFLF